MKKTAIKKDPLLEEAIQECEAFLKECKAYKVRINFSTTWRDGWVCYDDASTERGILKHRSLLLTRKLQAWKKKGCVV